jgi:hypothetical protein
MKYSFTTVTKTTTGGGTKTDLWVAESKKALTVKDIKSKCFEYLEIDPNKWVKDTEEVWAGGGSEDKALEDKFVLDKLGYFRGYYYLTLKPKA